MKKNKSLSNFEMHNSSVSSKNAIHKRTKDEEAIYAETSEKIKRGLGKVIRFQKYYGTKSPAYNL